MKVYGYENARVWKCTGMKKTGYENERVWNVQESTDWRRLIFIDELKIAYMACILTATQVVNLDIT